MYKRVVASILLVAFVMNVVGCSGTKHYVIKRNVLPKDITENAENVWVTLNDGTTHYFKSVEYGGTTLRGRTESGEEVTLDLAEARYIWVEKKGNIFLIAGAALFSTIGLLATGIVVVAALTSCPFVYSFDGEEYVLDSEPFGGAICRPLERTDYDVLDHIVSRNGKYLLKITNELEETQYIDNLNLIVVDHPANVQIAVDRYGNLHTLKELIPPSSVHDLDGQDLTAQFEQDDGLFWTSDLSLKDPDVTEDLRDELILEFPKPNDVDSAKLLMNLSNSPWSTYMFKRYLSLLGDQPGEFLEELGNDTVQLALFKDLLRKQGLLQFEVSLWKNGAWVSQGYVSGASPLLTQARITKLDVSGIDEDWLKVKLSMAAGFWMFDDAAVDYNTDEAIHATAVPPIGAFDQDGLDVRGILLGDDDTFYQMSDIGDHSIVEFAEPPSRPGLTRSVILEMRGYYEIHSDAAVASQSETSLHELLMTPDGASRYSLQVFRSLFEEAAKGSE